MKEIRTQDAAGHVLCHDITRIVRGVSKGVAFAKGHVVTEADIPALLALGKEHLFVWEHEAGMLHENDAAAILYGMCAGAHMRPTDAKEGKIEVVADADGLFFVDVERLKAVNALGEMMIATRHSGSPVRKGFSLAGTRVIPLVIEADKMEKAKAVAGPSPLLSLHPFHKKKFGLVITGSEVAKGRIEDTFTPVLREKLAEYDTEEMGHVVLGDDAGPITEAIGALIDKGAELVLCSGGMSVDPDDKTPLAIRNAAGRVVSYGAPVLPGAMFMLAYTDAGVPVMGLPGCVMYAKRTIFDLILPRIMADVPVSAADLAALGHGGLCLNCPTCIFPNCAFGAGV
ncbi:MAG: molybdopterin-binding protein [Oscillospiraceae bacterium]